MGRNFHIHWQKQKIFCRRDSSVFRTPSNISDEAFIMKMVNDKKSFLIFPKRLHHRCLIRSYIHLWEIYMTFYEKISGAVTFLSNASKFLHHVLIEYQFFRAILKNYFWSKSVFCFSILLESSYKLHKLWIIFTSNAVIYIVRICHVTNVKLPEHQQTRWSEQARYLKFKWLQQTMTISLTNNEPFRQIGLFD